MNNKFYKPIKLSALWIEFCVFASLAPYLYGQSDTSSVPKLNVPSTVKVVQTPNGYQLLKNGRPYFIKGAGGSRYLDALVAAGGNSIRTWSSSAEILEQAYEKGLTVCMGLRMGKPRRGFDYSDSELLAVQFERIRQTVLEFKSHPALLMWVIGNEVEYHASAEDRIKVWKGINKIAEMIKQIDKNHPVITVIAGTGSEKSGLKLVELKEYCPALDAIGINIYGGILKIPEQIAQQGWDKPYLITEFGPRGWWKVDRTAWGLPIEDTSTEKAEFYLKGYQHTIQTRAHCLGSYVFLWGNKQEKTHTWFGVFLPDGSLTGAVDAMTYSWTGKWPKNRSPVIGQRKVWIDAEHSSTYKPEHIYQPNTQLYCMVDTHDPDGDALTIKWDLRLDVSDNPNIGGDREEPTPPIENAILSTDKNMATIKVPGEEGNYRIFVYVYDGKGHAATVNVPIAVRKTQQPGLQPDGITLSK